MDMFDMLKDPNTVVLTKSQWETLELMAHEGNYMVCWPADACVVNDYNSAPIRGMLPASVAETLQEKGLIKVTEIRPRTLHLRITDTGREALVQFHAEGSEEPEPPMETCPTCNQVLDYQFGIGWIKHQHPTESISMVLKSETETQPSRHESNETEPITGSSPMDRPPQHPYKATLSTSAPMQARTTPITSMEATR